MTIGSAGNRSLRRHPDSRECSRDSPSIVFQITSQETNSVSIRPPSLSGNMRQLISQIYEQVGSLSWSLPRFMSISRSYFPTRCERVGETNRVDDAISRLGKAGAKLMQSQHGRIGGESDEEDR